MTAPNGTDARVVETHTALLFFVADHVYKIKKPVHLDFVDFRDRAARDAACRHEIGLGRRIAPDVYVGLGSVHSPDRAEPEPVVVLRRLPDDARLSTRMAAGADPEADLRAVARAVAAFHARAARGPQVDACAGADALLRRWTANLDETERFAGDLIDPDVHAAIRTQAVRFVEGRRALFAERVAAGLAVDGHGDLTAEDVFCLPDGPRILDCLDFDAQLRYVDQLDDAAFLAADLELLGHAGSGRRFLDLYTDFAGDPAPAALGHHYLAYRAFVRAKVACLRTTQHLGDDTATAHRAAQIAREHLRLGEVHLVLVGGGPGTGKTTLAGALADRLGWTVLGTDLIRAEHAVPREQRYVTAAKDAVYRDLLDRAGQALRRGESVVADATWTERAWRLAATELALATHSTLTMLECTAPADLAAARAEQRRRTAGSRATGAEPAGADLAGADLAGASEAGASEAGAEVALRLRRHRDPWPEAVPVDTSGPAGTAVDRAEAVVRR